jgi:energy-coupling factor transport system ATP-binding protein
VLRSRGAELAAGGVWVPGHEPVVPRPAAPVRAAPGQSQGQSAGEPALRARGVAVRRPGLSRPAVSGVDLDLPEGRALAVVGPNGAGKSSLALALSGLVAPDAGEVRVGAALAAGTRSPHPHRWRPRELVTRIGTVFQDPQHQFVTRTCAEELAVGPARSGVPAAQAARRVEELLDRLRLTPLARANPFTLSGGEQRRLSVATALATRPAVLVLDEPTFGQDARTWAELVALLGELCDEGTALVAVTHDIALVDAVADDVLELAAGAPTAGPGRLDREREAG